MSGWVPIDGGDIKKGMLVRFTPAGSPAPRVGYVDAVQEDPVTGKTVAVKLDTYARFVNPFATGQNTWEVFTA
jgi:hypothetical protein